MECIARHYLRMASIDKMDDKVKELLTQAILTSKDVLSMWFSATGLQDGDDDAVNLLKMIVPLFITIRSFAFSKASLEEHKKDTSRALSKSKGLRKEVFTTDTKKENTKEDGIMNTSDTMSQVIISKELDDANSMEK